jgi:ribosomal RNA assembly protein
MIEIVKIPERRKGVLIGKDGSVKKELEGKTNVKMRIDESVEIEGNSLDVLKVKEIVKAIGRGFSPEKAFKLLDENNRLIVITLGGTEKYTKRMLSRVIGTKGKTKRSIEYFTKTDLSIYGKTISIIGEWSHVEKAREAVEFLLEGKPHSYVYRFLGKVKE